MKVDHIWIEDLSKLFSFGFEIMTNNEAIYSLLILEFQPALSVSVTQGE